MSFSCTLCTTHGIPLCFVAQSHSLDVVNHSSKLVASTSCLLTESATYTMRCNETNFAIIVCSMEHLQYYVIFSTQFEHLHIFDELILRAAIAAQVSVVKYGTVLTRIIEYYDAKSSQDLANSTFADATADRLRLDDAVLEEVFGDDADGKEALTHLEDHFIHDLVYAPVIATLSESWFRPLVAALKTRGAAPASDASAFAYLVDAGLSSPHPARRCSLRQMSSQSLHCDEMQIVDASTARQLESRWLSAVRLYCSHPAETSATSYLMRSQASRCVASTRVLLFAPDTLPAESYLSQQCLVVARCTDRHVLVARLPLSMVDHAPLSCSQQAACSLQVRPLESVVSPWFVEAWGQCCSKMCDSFADGTTATDDVDASAFGGDPQWCGVHSCGCSSPDGGTSSVVPPVDQVLATIDETTSPARIIRRPIPPPVNKASASRSTVSVVASVVERDANEAQAPAPQKQAAMRPGRTLRAL